MTTCLHKFLNCSTTRLLGYEEKGNLDWTYLRKSKFTKRKISRGILYPNKQTNINMSSLHQQNPHLQKLTTLEVKTSAKRKR
jgi:hypothetical protein